jgi:hypothetical protein
MDITRISEFLSPATILGLAAPTFHFIWKRNHLQTARRSRVKEREKMLKQWELQATRNAELFRNAIGNATLKKSRDVAARRNGQ